MGQIRTMGRYVDMKQLFIVLVMVLGFSGSFSPLLAQRPAIAPAPTPAPVDSTRQTQTDSMPSSVRENGIRVKTPARTPTGDIATLTGADTLQLTAKQEAQIHRIIPKQATYRSLMLPGLGQAYNRQYYKIPFIYAGFGVMGYLFGKYSALAKDAAAGYKLLLYGIPIAPAQYATVSTVIAPELITQPVLVPPQSQKVELVQIGDNIFRSTAGAKSAYDTYRRYRDLNVILSIVLYAVNAVEANVAAHLKTFDLSDDISMRVEPNVIPMPGTGLVPAVRVALTFR